MDKMTLIQILLPVVILQLVLMITALISLVKQERAKGPKWLWGILILCVNIIGPVIYFIFGRKDEDR